MEAIDTNVVVRFLVGDDARQGTAAKDYLSKAEEAGESVFVSVPVILETGWVLENVYNCGRKEISSALNVLLRMPVLEIESHDRVGKLARNLTRMKLDFADLLIGLTAQDHNCETSRTFDRRAADTKLFTLLTIGRS